MAAAAKAPSGMPTARPMVADDVEVVNCVLVLADGLHVATIVVVKIAVVGVDVEMAVEEAAAMAELMRADCAASFRKGFPTVNWKGVSLMQQLPVPSASQQKVWSLDEQVTRLQYRLVLTLKG